MSTKGVNIRRGKVGVAVNGSNDSISGLLANGPAVVADVPNGISALPVGTAVKLTSRAGAASYGITAAYDSTNNVRVFRHIDEFYRKAGEGTVLWLMLYTGVPVDSLGTSYGKKIIASALWAIRQLGIAYNPASDYTATYVDGLEDDVRDALPAAQSFYDWTFETFRPCQIVIEGRGFNAVSAAAALDLRAITVTGTVMHYDKVSLCIGQDYDYAETQNAIGKKWQT